MKYITALLFVFGVHVQSQNCNICPNGLVDANAEVDMAPLNMEPHINGTQKCSTIADEYKDKLTEDCGKLQQHVNSTCCANVTLAPKSTPSSKPTTTPTTVSTASPIISPTTAPVPMPIIKNERNDSVTTNIMIRMDSVPSILDNDILVPFSFGNMMQVFLINSTTRILSETLAGNLLKVLVNVTVTDQIVFSQPNRRLSQRRNDRSMQNVEVLSNELPMKIDGVIMCIEDDLAFMNDLLWRQVLVRAISQYNSILIDSLRQSNETFYSKLDTITVLNEQVRVVHRSISSGAVSGIVIASLVVIVSCVIGYMYMKSKESNDQTICEKDESVKQSSNHQDSDDEVVTQTNGLEEHEQAQQHHKIKVPDMSWAAILTTKELPNTSLDASSDIEIFEQTRTVTTTGTTTKQVPKRFNQNPLIGTGIGLTKTTITLPKGELGISIATNIEIGPTISEVRSGSQLQGMVKVGNVILSVNGTDTRCLSGVSVAQILIDTSNVPERKMVLKS